MGSGIAAGGLARRGIEPAVPLAYAVLAIETIGALLIMLGLFTRLAAAAAAIEFAVITFVEHWANGFGFSSSGGGWEYPLFWGRQQRKVMPVKHDLLPNEIDAIKQ